jgi:hypothetical protein
MARPAGRSRYLRGCGKHESLIARYLSEQF